MISRYCLFLMCLLFSLVMPCHAETSIYWSDHGFRNIRKIEANSSKIDAGQMVLDRKGTSLRFWGFDIDSIGRRLYWDQSGGKDAPGLWRARLDGGEPELFIADFGYTSRFKIDDCRGKLFYADASGRNPALKRVSLRASDTEPDVVAPLPDGNPTALTLDTRGKRIYLLSIDTAAKPMEATIRSIGYSGGEWVDEFRFQRAKANIVGMAFHQKERTLVWTANAGGNDRVIEMVALDGDRRVRTLLSHPRVNFPAEIELSTALVSRRLYFADINNNYIGSIKLDGSGYRVHAIIPDVNNDVHPCGVDTHHETGRRPRLPWRR